MLKQIDSAPPVIQKIFDSVKSDMIDELWDSPDDIQAHYQEQSEYEKLLFAVTNILAETNE